MTKIYESGETEVGMPLSITATDDQICVVIHLPNAAMNPFTMLSSQEAMNIAFAIAEHFSGEKIAPVEVSDEG